MRAELKLKAGSKINASTVLYEGYEVTDGRITANVGVDKIEEIMQHFIVMHDEHSFFVLELPSLLDDENVIAPGIIKSSHMDVYYMDDCSHEEALTVLIRVGDLLYNDGLSSFGFGFPKNGEEILFGKYNVLTILSPRIEEYRGFMEAHDIEEAENLITAWDTITRETPGESSKYEKDGRSVYDIPKQFEEWGMYFAERRELD